VKHPRGPKCYEIRAAIVDRAVEFIVGTVNEVPLEIVGEPSDALSAA
jgi:hypothetical protein